MFLNIAKRGPRINGNNMCSYIVNHYPRNKSSKYSSYITALCILHFKLNGNGAPLLVVFKCIFILFYIQVPCLILSASSTSRSY